MKFVFSLVNVSNDRYSSLFKSMSWDMDDALSVSVTIRSLFIVSWRMESSLPPLIKMISCKIQGSSFSTILKVFSKKNCGKNSHTNLCEYIYTYTYAYLPFHIRMGLGKEFLFMILLITIRFQWGLLKWFSQKFHAVCNDTETPPISSMSIAMVRNLIITSQITNYFFARVHHLWCHVR